jgi:hypothetical protein
MPTRLAQLLMILAALASIFALAFQPQPLQDEMGAAMFTSVVVEQMLPLPQPANPDGDRDTAGGTAGSRFAGAPVAPPPQAPASVSQR